MRRKFSQTPTIVNKLELMLTSREPSLLFLVSHASRHQIYDEFKQASSSKVKGIGSSLWSYHRGLNWELIVEVPNGTKLHRISLVIRQYYFKRLDVWTMDLMKDEKIVEWGVGMMELIKDWSYIVVWYLRRLDHMPQVLSRDHVSLMNRNLVTSSLQLVV